MAFKNTRVPCMEGFLWNIYTLTNSFVTSVFVKVYRGVYWKVEVKLLFSCFSKNAQISGTKKFSKSKKKCSVWN